jgi:hypothetical protein
MITEPDGIRRDNCVLQAVIRESLATIPAECGSIADNNDDLFLREHRNGNSHKGADNTEKPTAHVSSFRTSALGGAWIGRP